MTMAAFMAAVWTCAAIDQTVRGAIAGTQDKRLISLFCGSTGIASAMAALHYLKVWAATS